MGAIVWIPNDKDPPDAYTARVDSDDGPRFALRVDYEPLGFLQWQVFDDEVSEMDPVDHGTAGELHEAQGNAITALMAYRSRLRRST
jgi:hypothetical protein